MEDQILDITPRPPRSTAMVIIKSALSIVLLIICLFVINYLLGLLLDHVIFKALEWFNSQSTFVIILIMLLGGFMIFMTLLQVSGIVSGIMGAFLGKYFIQNGVVLVISMLLIFLNTGYTIYQLWYLFPDFNFLLGLEFFILCIYIFTINWSLLGADPESKH